MTLKTAAADTLFLPAIPKIVAQAIREAHDLNRRPAIILTSVGSSVGQR
jgi:branched-chain amino acid transport system substrate-binding protein